MTLITVFILTLVPMIQAFRSDLRGWTSAKKEWAETYAKDPITAPPKPLFDIGLFLARMADGFLASLVLVITVYGSSPGNVIDRAAVESIVRDLNATTQPTGGAQ